jgi:hypothetical protein
MHVNQYQKEKQNVMASTSTEAPLQVPNATEIIGIEAPMQHEIPNATQIAGDKNAARQQMCPLLADIFVMHLIPLIGNHKN